jgi:hypothetical protein
MTQSEWHKPELVVLVRSRPEEAVLQMCKAEATPAHSLNHPTWNDFKGCLTTDKNCAQNCQDRGGKGS